MERSELLIGNMFYVIRYDTWTVEETDVHDLRDPKFATELEAEEQVIKELSDLVIKHLKDDDQFIYRHYNHCWRTCYDRIQKLKQQSI